MLGTIASITLGAAFALLVGTLAASAPLSQPARLATLAIASAWAAAIVAIAALGGFLAGAAGPVPAVGYAFAALLGAGLAAWFLAPRFREALLAIPLPVLIGLNATRIVGAFFLILYAAGDLPAPFAPLAGWGDVIVAVLAVPLAIAVARGTARPRTVRLWNGLGVLDLVAAVGIGVLSAPDTPFRVFGSGAGTAIIGALPWVLIPAVLVPIYLIIHLTVEARARSAPAGLDLALA